VGVLGEIGLGTLLTVLDLERRSGVVSVHGPDGAAGQLTVRDGRIVAAATRGPGPLVGRAAAYEMLSWTTGRFVLRTDEAALAGAIETELDCSTTHLLMDAARVQDELAA
jgi:hypothetical protein